MPGEENMQDFLKVRKRKIKKIITKTKKNMTELNTYKEEFDEIIKRYAEMYFQYELLQSEWYLNGCVITEEYTNKAGYTNVRKTALYISLEALRKELLDMENVLGLTPKGLKQIKSNGLKGKKISALDKALENV